jgi:hypothetical protein
MNWHEMYAPASAAAAAAARTLDDEMTRYAWYEPVWILLLQSGRKIRTAVLCEYQLTY